MKIPALQYPPPCVHFFLPVIEYKGQLDEQTEYEEASGSKLDVVDKSHSLI
jgi:hypothetical protein